jgi:hypothetical protein
LSLLSGPLFDGFDQRAPLVRDASVTGICGVLADHAARIEA